MYIVYVIYIYIQRICVDIAENSNGADFAWVSELYEATSFPNACAWAEFNCAAGLYIRICIYIYIYITWIYIYIYTYMLYELYE